jgi:hypothetical protein
MQQVLTKKPKRGAALYGTNCREDEFGQVVRSGFILTVKRFIFVERKNYNGIFLPGYKEWKSDYNRNQLIKIYRSHGRKCGLERNEYLGKILRRVWDLLTSFI